MSEFERNYDRDESFDKLKGLLSPGCWDYLRAKFLNPVPLGKGNSFVVIWDAGTNKGAKLLLQNARGSGDIHSQRIAREHTILEHLGNVNCPNVQRVYELIKCERTFRNLGYGLDIDPLAREINATSLKVNEVVLVMKQYLRGLIGMHNEGVVHRDIKPGNLLVIKEAFPSFINLEGRIIDFNVSIAERLFKANGRIDGDIVGTPKYMSPELSSGRPGASHMDDLWAFAVVFYEMMIGGDILNLVPFPVSGATNVMRLMQRDWLKIKDVAPFNCLPNLFKVLEKALGYHLGERFLSGGELLQAVDEAAARDGLVFNEFNPEVMHQVKIDGVRRMITFAVSNISLQANESWGEAVSLEEGNVPEGDGLVFFPDRVISVVRPGVKEVFTTMEAAESGNISYLARILRELSSVDSVPNLLNVNVVYGREYGLAKENFLVDTMSLDEVIEESLVDLSGDIQSKEAALVQFFIGLAKALKEIHDCGVVHGRLTHRSIRFKHFPEAGLLLSKVLFEDFHGASFVEDSEIENRFNDLVSVERNYRDPDFVKGYGRDIYALGQCMLRVLVTTLIPRHSNEINSWEGDWELDDLDRLGCSSQLVDVLELAIHPTAIYRFSSIDRLIEALEGFYEEHVMPSSDDLEIIESETVYLLREEVSLTKSQEDDLVSCDGDKGYLD